MPENKIAIAVIADIGDQDQPDVIYASSTFIPKGYPKNARLILLLGMVNEEIIRRTGILQYVANFRKEREIFQAEIMKMLLENNKRG